METNDWTAKNAFAHGFLQPVQKLALSVGGLFWASVALVPHAMAREPAQFDVARLSADMKQLASDAFEGREPGSKGEQDTIAFIAQRMKEAGLQPAGDDGGWFQKVPLLKSELVGAPAFEIATNTGTLRPVQREQIMARAPSTGQSHVQLDKLPLVFAGYGVNAPERGWNDFKGTDLRGKVIVVLVNDPDFEGGEGDFGGKMMTYHGRWTYKFEEAARQGAAGVLIVHEDAPATYGWSTVVNSFGGKVFDIVRQDPTKHHAPFEGWIGRDFAARLFEAAGLDFEEAKAEARKAHFRPIALKANISADYTAKTEIIASHNVAGVLPGRTAPDETVIYSGHWDSFGIGQPDEAGDRIHNGAVDNASGIAALIELAREFKAAGGSERSVLFLAVTAEEQGLLGSEYYSQNPLRPLAKTAGAINVDVPFAFGRTRDFGVVGVVKLELLDLLVEEGVKLGRYYAPDDRPEAGGFYRSDHFPFAKRGVPAISYVGGSDIVDGGKERGKKLSDAYSKERYHRPADNYDPDWNTDNIIPDLTLMYNLGHRLANSRLWPEWPVGSEFRSIRQETAGER